MINTVPWRKFCLAFFKAHYRAVTFQYFYMRRFSIYKSYIYISRVMLMIILLIWRLQTQIKPDGLEIIKMYISSDMTRKLLPAIPLALLSPFPPPRKIGSRKIVPQQIPPGLRLGLGVRGGGQFSTGRSSLCPAPIF